MFLWVLLYMTVLPSNCGFKLDTVVECLFFLLHSCSILYVVYMFISFLLLCGDVRTWMEQIATRSSWKCGLAAVLFKKQDPFKPTWCRSSTSWQLHWNHGRVHTVRVNAAVSIGRSMTALEERKIRMNVELKKVLSTKTGGFEKILYGRNLCYPKRHCPWNNRQWEVMWFTLRCLKVQKCCMMCQWVRSLEVNSPTEGKRNENVCQKKWVQTR